MERAALVGVDVVALVTSGMYTDPLVVYREYIQNAADAIHGGRSREDGEAEVVVGYAEARVTIRDNGPGLSLEQAKRALVPIASSQKRRGEGRGFRGIGRLAGLAFGKSVTFLSRAEAEARVVRVAWDGGGLREGIAAGESLESVLANSVTVDAVSGDGYPARFCEVHIDGISRYAAASIMNKEVVRRYIGEVCPVPFAEDFPYGRAVSRLFGAEGGPLTVNVRLDGEKLRVKRPHGGSVKISETREEEIVGFEEIKIVGLGERKYSAIGWVAHTSYGGAIRKDSGVRCLRARVGNAQIGGENLFDHLFVESRFNRWCIGEVHVLEPAIVPNARRDYFEQGPHLRDMENQLGAVCRSLERRCRAASRRRRETRRVRDFLAQGEEALELAGAGYLGADGARRYIAGKIVDIAILTQKCTDDGNYDECLEALKRMERRFKAFQPGPWKSVDPSEMARYSDVFEILTELAPRPAVAKRTIEAILERVDARAPAHRSLGAAEAGRRGDV